MCERRGRVAFPSVIRMASSIVLVTIGRRKPNLHSGVSEGRWHYYAAYFYGLAVVGMLW